MSRSSLITTLTSPRVLTQASSFLDSAYAAWSLRRTPRSSAAVLRRALVSTALVQGATIAGVAAGRQALAGEMMYGPLSGFQGPVGDVPVLVSRTWEGAPLVSEINGKLAMVVGVDFDKLARAEQEKQYHDALHSWFPPTAAVAIGASAAASRALLHRGLIGQRSKVSKSRAAALAVAMTAAEAGLYAVARQVTTRRRHTRVAAERTR